MLTRFLTADHWRPEKHWLACRIIREMYANYRPTLNVRSDYPALVQPNDGLDFWEATNNKPSSLLLWDDGNACLFLRGVIPGLHISGIINGWYNLHRATNPLGTNQYLWDCATNVIQNFAALLAGRRNWWIFGHSFGGAVGQLVADQLQRMQLTNSVSIFTYGSPRPGGLFARKALERFQTFRYFFDNDLVVRNPPHSTEYPILSYFLPLQALVNVDSQVQPEKGYVLPSSGPMVRQELCTNGPWPYLTSFEPLLNNLLSSGNPLHFLPRYLDYWDAAMRLATPMRPVDASVLDDEPIVMTQRDRGRQQEEFANIVVANIANYRPTATPLEPGAAIPSTTAIFKRRKLGRLWVVTLRDDVVDIGPTKRQARVKAHHWNRVIPVQQR